MLIQHEETGTIAEIPDGQPIPPRYYRVPEAARVGTVKATLCPECGRYQPTEGHHIGCRMRKFLPWK